MCCAEVKHVYQPIGIMLTGDQVQVRDAFLFEVEDQFIFLLSSILSIGRKSESHQLPHVVYLTVGYIVFGRSGTNIFLHRWTTWNLVGHSMLMVHL